MGDTCNELSIMCFMSICALCSSLCSFTAWSQRHCICMLGHQCSAGATGGTSDSARHRRWGFGDTSDSASSEGSIGHPSWSPRLGSWIMDGNITADDGSSLRSRGPIGRPEGESAAGGRLSARREQPAAEGNNQRPKGVIGSRWEQAAAGRSRQHVSVELLARRKASERLKVGIIHTEKFSYSSSPGEGSSCGCGRQFKTESEAGDRSPLGREESAEGEGIR